MKPVIYLDIDGVLNIWPTTIYEPATGVKEFLEWAVEFAEVRWLTYWTFDGTLSAKKLYILSTILDVDPELLRKIKNPLPHDGYKPMGINWKEHDEGREWYWLDDHQIDEWLACLSKNEALDHFILVKSAVYSDALQKAKEEILKRHKKLSG